MPVESGVSNELMVVFSDTVTAGFALVAGAVNALFALMIVLVVALTGIYWALSENRAALSSAFSKILLIGFFAYLINDWQALSETLYSGFIELGLMAGGGSISAAEFLNPGAVIETGWDIVNRLGENPAHEAGALVGRREVLSPFAPEFRTLLAVTRSSQVHRLEFLRGLAEASAALPEPWPSGLQVRDEAVAALVSEVVVLAGLRPRTWSREAGMLRMEVSRDEIAARAFDRSPGAPRRLVSVRQVASVATACVGVDASDRLYLAGRGMVPTHNTGKKPSPRFTDEAFFQLEVYALALAESREIVPHALRLVYTNEAARSGVLERQVTPEILERTRRKVRAVWDGIARCDRAWHDANLRGDDDAMEKAWETRKQPLCDWCHFGPKQTNVCPAWNPALAGMLPQEQELRLSSRPGRSADATGSDV